MFMCILIQASIITFFPFLPLSFSLSLSHTHTLSFSSPPLPSPYFASFLPFTPHSLTLLIAGVDYQDVSIKLTLVPGPSASVCTKLTIFNDRISEGALPEYFQLSLDAPKQTLRGRNITIDTRTVQVAIFDDEGEYMYSI